MFGELVSRVFFGGNQLSEKGLVMRWENVGSWGIYIDVEQYTME